MRAAPPTTVQSVTSPFAWARPLALPLLLLIAAALRFYALDASSLWSDEGNTYALIQRTYAQITRDAAADIHPPLYYWLLKAWSSAFGITSVSMRAFSALLGVLLVAVTYQIGAHLDRHLVRRLNGHTSHSSAIALTAGLIAAFNPFQIYYSQEARMYMLLACAGAALFWALLVWITRESAARPITLPLVGFILSGALGLWTHYSFPILLAAAGLAYLWHWRTQISTRTLTRYILANLAILLIFAPWLPTAITRVLAWPQGGDDIAFSAGIQLTLQTLAFGPLRALPTPLWPWLFVVALLPIAGIIALLIGNGVTSTHTHRALGVTIALWWLAPVGLMFALGLFTDAFLKFLLVAAPAWTILCASAPLLVPWPRLTSIGVALGAIALAAVTLPTYYTSSTVRDNYAGVAAYLTAIGDPSTDLVILDAPGQGDVWSYYAPDLPVLGLPQSRPPDPDATLAQLEAAVQDRRHVYALFWATNEADPDRLVESWLDQHAFRGLASWQGNLRFVVYSLPNQLACQEYAPPIPFGDAIQLTAQCQPNFPQSLAAGEVALLGLQWQTTQPLATNYKVTVQLLDARNQVIAQHDAEPAGGSRPTSTWDADTAVMDNHGLTVPVGTPPGTYRLIVALYEQENFTRLPTPTGDAYELGAIEVTRAGRSLPIALVDMDYRANRQLGPLQLIGYDAHKRGFSDAPDTPLQPGDLAHFTFYWHAPAPLPIDWPADLTFTLTLGDQTVTAPLAGGAYPTVQWQAGEFVRGEFDIPYNGSSHRPTLEIAGTRYQLAPLPH